MASDIIHLASEEWVSDIVSGLTAEIGSGVTINTVYKYIKINSPTGNLNLDNWTETYIGTISSGNTITVILPTPANGLVNESILIFKTGSSIPTIYQPTGVVWRGNIPILGINSTWTIVYEQVFTETDFEIYAVAIKNI